MKALCRLCAGLAVWMSLAAQAQIAPVITVDHGPNAPAQQARHYVVLVSLDGFRYDYARKYGAEHLLQIARQGASAPDGMIPSYPSITFPNHYTLVTGLYPEHHGIVAMSFYDPARHERYAFNDPKTATDGSWYGGEPLWVLAEKQGMRSACFFWPGSEAKIDGERPSYYLKYDDHFPDDKRIEQVVEWLKLPPAQRPHFITLYYSNTDHAGHEFGPDSQQVASAVRHVDGLIGQLKAELDALKLPIDLIVVSDHGMVKEQGGWIDLDGFDSEVDAVTSTGDLLYPQDDAQAQALYNRLKAADSRFVVYRRAQVPAELHYNANPREGDPVVIPLGPYAIRAEKPPAGREDRLPNTGSHGYNPYTMPEMKAIFYAEGPDIKPGVKLKPFENVNVYPLITHLLGLKQSGPIDGSYDVLSGAVAEQ
jgi:predicted AlkP superfamily pyrophosphatase or phosphodiesterase